MLSFIVSIIGCDMMCQYYIYIILYIYNYIIYIYIWICIAFKLMYAFLGLKIN